MTIEETIKVLSHEQTCVMRQIEPGCDRNCAACDLVLPDEMVLSAYRMAINLLSAQQEAEKNDPLTLEDLRSMHGKPVFVTAQIEENDALTGMWMIVSIWEDEIVFLVDEYGDEWFADNHCIKEIRRRPRQEAET